MPDHVHMLLSVTPRYSIAMTVGFSKGKSAIRIHRDHSKFKGTLFGRSFWASGYCVSTVGLVPKQAYPGALLPGILAGSAWAERKCRGLWVA